MLKTLWLLAVLSVAVAGCGRQLYHYHRTVVGVDISGNVAGNTPSGHLILGYSRRLVVLMPPEIQAILDARAKANEAVQTTDLPNTVFCTQVKASFGGVNSFREVLATGDPAESYAQRLSSLAVASSADPYRNLVCPGFEIPKPDSSAGPQATNSKATP